MNWLLGKSATFTPNMTDRKCYNGNMADFIEEKTGVVDYINEEHDYFRVKYEVRGNFFHECFKFSQIGEDKDVVIHG